LFTFSSGITRSRGFDGSFFEVPSDIGCTRDLKQTIFKSIMSLRYGVSYDSKLLGVKGAVALQTSITCCNIDIVRYIIICRSPIYINNGP